VAVAEDPLVGVSPFTDFVSAAEGAVAFLHGRVGLDLWLVTQVVDDRQVAIAAYPSYLVSPGMGIPWAEGFCSRMVQGKGPRVASVTAAVPEYAGLTFGPAERVSAYLGVPLLRADGAVFGTLCGFGARAQPPSLGRHLPLVEHTARMLSTILAQEGAAVLREQRVEQAIEESERDALTGLLNRRGWDRALEVEEARCQREGRSATVVVLDLDDLKDINDAQGHPVGDDYLRRTSEILRDNSRPSDVIARTGGDEYAVMISHATGRRSAAVDAAYVARLSGQLAAAECAVSLGYAARTEGDGGVLDAWWRADAEMYAVKAARRGRP
jgi:diguanylate cyclase (GGDEF)-like protein